MNNINFETYFTRQTRLKEVGITGQQKLKNSHILVVGAGGLGCPFLNYVCAAGIGEITLYDHDTIDLSNLHRQTLYSPKDIGKNKAIMAKKHLESKYPFSKINAIPDRFQHSKDLSSTEFTAFDFIIDCTDNFKTKFLLHDLSFFNKKKFLIASIHKFEGVLQYFDFEDKKQDSCLRCLYPEQPTNDCVETCAEAGIIGAVAGSIGTLQALELIKIILGINLSSSGQTILFDLIHFKQTSLPPFKDAGCPLCGTHPKEIKDSTHEFEISADYFNQQKNHVKIINLSKHDLNLKDEFKFEFQKFKTMLNDLAILPFSKDEKIFIVCHRGVSSLKLTKTLRQLEYPNAYSLEYGLDPLLKNN